MTTDSSFIARINVYEDALTPARAYVFRNGFEEGYDGNAVEAKEHLLESLPWITEYGQFDYVLAAIWFNQVTKTRTMDFMGYSGLEGNWKGNPEVDPFILRGGVFVPRNEGVFADIQPGKNSFCGATMRMLGREEDYRLMTKSLRKYFEIPPHLGDLEPQVSI